MVTKLNKLLFLIVVILANKAYAQDVSFNIVNLKEISINNLRNLDLNPQEKEIITIFGKPLKKVIIPPQPEWDDGGVQLLYENNTEFYYSKHGDNYYLEKIHITSNKYNLIIKNDTISLGSDINKIGGLFDKSYEYFKNHNIKPYNISIQKFYLTIIKDINNNHYTTSLTLKSKDDIVISIDIKLIEGN